MRARFRKTSRVWTSGLLLILFLSGCQIANNKWLRIHREHHQDVTNVKLKLVSFVGPKDRVERFFQSYQLRDWKAMDAALTPYSDLHFIKEKVEEDFKKYAELIPEIAVASPKFNDAHDKAQVNVEFSIEKIDRVTGSLYKNKGTGTFVLTEKGSWDITGYVGDPFWGDDRP